MCSFHGTSWFLKPLQFFVVLLAMTVAPWVVAQPSDEGPAWSQWRGPDRDGSIDGPPWPNSLSDDHLKSLWRVELGPSYSGPIVTGNRVFVTETIGKRHERVRALDRKTGKQLWETQWPGSMTVPFFASSNGSWIRSTPAYDDGKLYVGGMLDVLVCLDANDGKEIWRMDFPKQRGTKKPDFGFVCSPLVLEGAVYVQAGSAFYKLDKQTGQVLWESLNDGGGMFGSAFSSPFAVTWNGQTQILVQTRQKLCGVDPASGAILWSQTIPTFRGMNILTPTVHENSVFTSAYGGRSFLFQIERNGGQWQAAQAWENPLQAYMSTPVIKDGHAYLHLRNQRFACIDLETGQTKWRSEPFGKYASLVVQGDRILALDQRGELLLIRATPSKFELIDRARVSDQETWAHLAISGNALFVRELNAIAALRLAN